jgi:cytochrome c biogenesis protein CcmG/thiol:disulfide interchange protein DsbE
MGGSARRGGQAIALVAVAALLALLVWKITKSDSGVAGDLSKGKRPAAPTAALAVLGSSKADARLSITDLKGKAVIVNFWATWCLPCKEETPFLQRYYVANKAKGIVVLGIVNESFKGDAVRFLRRYGVTYPAVFGPGQREARRWGVNGYPETFFVDRTGHVVGSRILSGVDLDRNRQAFDEGVALALGSG